MTGMEEIEGGRRWKEELLHLYADGLIRRHPDLAATAERLIAEDAGWLTRIEDAIETGLTAEASGQRVQNDIRARMAQVTDPYLRERVHDLLLRHVLSRNEYMLVKSHRAFPFVNRPWRKAPFEPRKGSKGPPKKRRHRNPDFHPAVPEAGAAFRSASNQGLQKRRNIRKSRGEARGIWSFGRLDSGSAQGITWRLRGGESPGGEKARKSALL